MKNNKYTVSYIPRYVEDLNEVIDYIVIKLQNPTAAMNLVDRIERAILERLNSPLSFEPFHSSRKRENPYYRIYVGNFVVYYVVIGNVMEVRRLLYKARNADELIK